MLTCGISKSASFLLEHRSGAIAPIMTKSFIYTGFTGLMGKDNDDIVRPKLPKNPFFIYQSEIAPDIYAKNPKIQPTNSV